MYSTCKYLFCGYSWLVAVPHAECSCYFPPSDANRGPAAEGWVRVVLSVTPQQAAVVLELGACFNYCIISPPTLSLISGENDVSVLEYIILSNY